jgi:hypothetical protein
VGQPINSFSFNCQGGPKSSRSARCAIQNRNLFLLNDLKLFSPIPHGHLHEQTVQQTPVPVQRFAPESEQLFAASNPTSTIHITFVLLFRSQHLNFTEAMLAAKLADEAKRKRELLAATAAGAHYRGIWFIGSSSKIIDLEFTDQET